MIKEFINEVLVQAEIDHTRIITIYHIKRSLLFYFDKKITTRAILWSTRVLSSSKHKKKIQLRSFRRIRNRVHEILKRERALDYIFRIDVLIFLGGVLEFLKKNNQE